MNKHVDRHCARCGVLLRAGDTVWRSTFHVPLVHIDRCARVRRGPETRLVRLYECETCGDRVA